MAKPFETRLTDRFDTLSGALRRAAAHVEAHPVEIATRPLRAVARQAEVSPAAFTRLAKALGYADFEALREEFRARIQRRAQPFAARAERLQQDHGAGETGFYDAHLRACQANLGAAAELDRAQLDAAIDRLAAARRVRLLGALGSTGVVAHLAYMAGLCADNWRLANPGGGSAAAGITGLDERDALIIVTKPPFSQQAIVTARLASDRGVFVIVITDTHSCPALRHASAGFVLPTASPQFYSSYVTTMFFVEALIGLLVSRSGEAARARIAEVERTTRDLAEIWSQ